MYVSANGHTRASSTFLNSMVSENKTSACSSRTSQTTPSLGAPPFKHQHMIQRHHPIIDNIFRYFSLDAIVRRQMQHVFVSKQTMALPYRHEVTRAPTQKLMRCTRSHTASEPARRSRTGLGGHSERAVRSRRKKQPRQDCPAVDLL